MYHLAAVAAPGQALAGDRRVPRLWCAAAIPTAAADAAVLRWFGGPIDGPARLRLAVAVDEREEKRVSVAVAGRGGFIGEFDIRYAHVFQPFELELDASNVCLAVDHGLAMHVERGTAPLWILTDGPTGCDALLPHLYTPDGAEPIGEFRRRLASVVSLQPFGWLEGCVLDALWDLGEREALAAHLAQFFDRDGAVIGEDLYSAPRDNALYGIESTLMFATVARALPGHGSLSLAVSAWREWTNPRGVIQDGALLSAEGCYTVAYPMCVLAALGQAPAGMAEAALRQLRVRRDSLIDGADLWLRRHDDGRREFRNWARAAAWYMLGLTRSLIALRDGGGIDDLRRECARVCAWAIERQRPDGLWSCFIGEPLPPDTSGSAGVAAALALAAAHGLAPRACADAAQRALAGLTRYLTPDGFLHGVAQTNKAGEALQRSDYRVIGQFGMGMLGQLIAALG